jgi:phosphate transport system substrate-binding protein
MEKFCNGETDLSGASRLMREDEEQRCKDAGIGYDFITVANDALAVVVNKDNPIQCLTVAQVSEFWVSGSTVNTWGQSSATVPADFQSQQVTLYGPGTDSGTFDLFTNRINGEAGNIRTDYVNIGEDDNLAVQGVAGDVGAISFIPYSYFQESLDLVRGLEIDNGNGCFGPTEANLVSEDYRPLGRALYWYASNTALQRPETVAFFDFVIENNDEIAETAGFIGLTQGQKDTARAKVLELAG